MFNIETPRNDSRTSAHSSNQGEFTFGSFTSRAPLRPELEFGLDFSGSSRSLEVRLPELRKAFLMDAGQELSQKIERTQRPIERLMMERAFAAFGPTESLSKEQIGSAYLCMLFSSNGSIDPLLLRELATISPRAIEVLKFEALKMICTGDFGSIFSHSRVDFSVAVHFSRQYDDVRLFQKIFDLRGGSSSRSKVYEGTPTEGPAMSTLLLSVFGQEGDKDRALIVEQYDRDSRSIRRIDLSTLTTMEYLRLRFHLADL